MILTELAAYFILIPVKKSGRSQQERCSPEIRLNLDGDGAPEEILFYNPRTEYTGSELLSDSSGKGRRALALLILFTAKERKRRITRLSKICLPSSTREFTSTLAEEITNPNLTKKTHWLEQLFGENPKGLFVEAARLKDDTAYFLDNVLVTVSNYLDKECSIEDLSDSFDRYSDDEGKRARKIGIAVEVEECSERKGYTIRAGDRSGSITNGDQIRVIVTPNYSTSLAVFWVSSDGSVSQFYPTPDRKLEIRKSVVQQQKIGSLLEIPEKLYLDINTDPGTETCIVVAATRAFDRKECVKLEGIFQTVRRSWLITNTIDRPRDRVIRRPCIKKAKRSSATEEVRIARPRRLDKWENSLLKQMPDQVTSIRFFHIPHI